MLVFDLVVEKLVVLLSVSVGLLYDLMLQQGMVYYFEYMLFLGIECYLDIKGYIEFMIVNGGQYNVYIWLDIINYMFKINNDVYGEVLDCFFDFFKVFKFYLEYIDKEKNVVNVEWFMCCEMDYFGQFKLVCSLMGDYLVNCFLIGNLEIFGDKEGSKLYIEMVNFYECYYLVNIMKLVMISNCLLDEMKVLVEEYFGNIENKSIDNLMVDDKFDFVKVGGK